MRRFPNTRAGDRVPVRMATKVRCYGDRFIGTVVSLSAGGVFIRSARVLPTDAEVEMTISPGDGDTPAHLTVTGRVVYHNDTGMGVKFHALPPAATARVNRVLARHLAEAGRPLAKPGT